MSFWSTAKSIFSGAVDVGKQVVTGMLGGGANMGMGGSSLLPSLQNLPVGAPAGTPAPGRSQAIFKGQVMPGGAPTTATQIGQLLSGAVPGMVGARKMKRGRLTGNAIPAGYVERMSNAGVVYLAKSSRRRGISARDLSAFRRVDRLIHRYQRRAIPRRGK